MYILKLSVRVTSRFYGSKSEEGEAGVIRKPSYVHTSIDVIIRSMLQTMFGTSDGKQDVRVSRTERILWKEAMVCEMLFYRAFKNTCTPP